jgi:hypothetical protein
VSELTHDLEQARRYLDVLAGGETVTFQTFSDREELKIKRPGKKDYDPNAKVGHGTLERDEDAAPVAHLNAVGAGVYVMANAGDGKGRTAKNVTRVRALFIDTDGAPYPDPLPLRPHLVVESSPGKWHLYWLIDGLELADFATLQKALAEHYGTDPSIHDLPRVMRLPGFYHCKAEPVMVQLLQAHHHPPYTPADVFEAWLFLPERLEAEAREKAETEAKRERMLKLARERRKLEYRPDERDQERLDKLLQAHHDAVAAAPDGQRHETLKNHARALGGYVGSSTLTLEEAQEVLAPAAEVCGLPEGEAADVIRWGLEKGQSEPLVLESFPEQPRFDENTCSGKQSPWLSQKADFTNRNTTQIGNGWNGGKSPWQ